ncbi:MAG: hypothetical protein HQ538_00875 [Parcubacteria group bacterium]|nr:hypothetical protein [Parcubacteria group bacterium]
MSISIFKKLIGSLFTKSFNRERSPVTKNRARMESGYIQQAHSITNVIEGDKIKSKQRPTIDLTRNLIVCGGRRGNWVEFNLINIGKEVATELKYYFSYDGSSKPEPVLASHHLSPQEISPKLQFSYKESEIFIKEVKNLRLNIIYKDTEDNSYHSGRKLKQEKRADGNYNIDGYLGDRFDSDPSNSSVVLDSKNKIVKEDGKNKQKSHLGETGDHPADKTRGNYLKEHPIIVLVGVIATIITIAVGIIAIKNYFVNKKPILDVEIGEYTVTTTDKYTGTMGDWISINPILKNVGNVPITYIQTGFHKYNPTSTKNIYGLIYTRGLVGKILGVGETLSLPWNIPKNLDRFISYRFDVVYRSVYDKKDRCKTIILTRGKTKFFQFSVYSECPKKNILSTLQARLMNIVKR